MFKLHKLIPTPKLLTFALLVLGGFIILSTQKVSAIYNGANLIDNRVFLDSQSMSKEDVQSFLALNGSGLASRNYVISCYGPDSKERQWYTAVGAPCDQSIPASYVIYYAAQIYGVNPKVVLATLQKEQSLITASNPTSTQLDQAMGYGCPTTGVCGTSNFSAQIDSGVWVLRYHYERANGNNTWWNNGGYTCGNKTVDSSYSFYRPGLVPGQNVTFYDGQGYKNGGQTYTYTDSSGNPQTGGVAYRTYTISNAATAAMYCYTPHAYNNPQGLYGREPFGTVGQYYSGSYNFVYWFEKWWVSTLELNTWSIIAQGAFTDNTKQTRVDLGNLAANSRYYLTVTLQNTGNVNWEKLGSNPASIGTTTPRDRTSSFCDPAWLGCNRPATLHEYVVSPGQYGSFEFWITTPPNPGNYNEIFAPLIEGKLWMDTHTISFPMVVPPVYSWSLASQYAYTDGSKTTGVDLTNLTPGQKVFVGFRATNTGNTTWTNTGTNPVRAGTTGPRDRNSSFCDGTWSGCNRPVTMSEPSVAPGGTGTFEFWYKAPYAGYTGYERFSLMLENYIWMNDPGMSFYTKAPASIYSWSLASQYAYTDDTKTTAVDLTNLSPGQRVFVGFQATNTGNATWTSSGANPIRAGTTGPRDRNSSFCDSTWAGCNRPTTVQPSSVAPGQTGTFEFWYKAPNSGFTSFEQFSLMLEGYTWMNDPGMSFYTKVR